MCRALAWLELLCSGLWEASVSGVSERARARERERGEGETRGYVQTSDSHYLISALRHRLRALRLQQEARSERGGTISLLHTTTCLVAADRFMGW